MHTHRVQKQENKYKVTRQNVPRGTVDFARLMEVFNLGLCHCLTYNNLLDLNSSRVYVSQI